MKDSRDRIRERVLGQILPDHSVSALALGLFFLFVSPFLLCLLFPEIYGNQKLFAYVLVSFALFFSLFSGLAGIFLLGRRNPYLEEWKEKFGYNEEL